VAVIPTSKVVPGTTSADRTDENAVQAGSASVQRGRADRRQAVIMPAKVMVAPVERGTARDVDGT
jgi:hypothetical protein